MSSNIQHANIYVREWSKYATVYSTASFNIEPMRDIQIVKFTPIDPVKLAVVVLTDALTAYIPEKITLISEKTGNHEEFSFSHIYDPAFHDSMTVFGKKKYLYTAHYNGPAEHKIKMILCLEFYLESDIAKIHHMGARESV